MSLKEALSKTSSRFILAVLSLLTQIIGTIVFTAWGQIDMAQFFFAGMSPLTTLAFKWYFEKQESSKSKLQ